MTSSAWMIAWGPPWVPFDTLRNWSVFSSTIQSSLRSTSAPLNYWLNNWLLNILIESVPFFSVAWHTSFRSNDQPRQVFVFTSVWWKLRSSLALSWHVHRRADLALWRVLHGLHEWWWSSLRITFRHPLRARQRGYQARLFHVLLSRHIALLDLAVPRIEAPKIGRPGVRCWTAAEWTIYMQRFIHKYTST